MHILCLVSIVEDNYELLRREDLVSKTIKCTFIRYNSENTTSLYLLTWATKIHFLMEDGREEITTRDDDEAMDYIDDENEFILKKLNQLDKL